MVSGPAPRGYVEATGGRRAGWWLHRPYAVARRRSVVPSGQLVRANPFGSGQSDTRGRDTSAWAGEAHAVATIGHANGRGLGRSTVGERTRRPRLTRCATLCAVLSAVIVSSLLPGASTAQAALLPGYYTIQAKQSPATSPRDHRVLFVGAGSSSTTEPVRLFSPIQDPIQRQRLQWQLDQQSITFNGSSHTAYVLVNRYYHGCLTWIRPLIGNGTRVGQAAYPGTGCSSWPQKWVLNNGSRWVRITDPHGSQVGFQLNIPVRVGLVYCLDVTGLRYTAGNHLQEWRCTGNWNQRFVMRRVAVP